MPFVNIALARGKSREYLEGVSRAVHDALAAELSMQPDEDFQLISQHDPGEMVFNRDFRGGPRSDDWIVFTITEGIDRGSRAKRKFYKDLVRRLEAGPGVRPADVFVMFYHEPIENFSFADGIAGSETGAIEALAAAHENPGGRTAYGTAELSYAVQELFEHRDSHFILPMLRDDFRLELPASLPYGGDLTGREAFEKFFSAGVPGGDAVWESFEVHVEQIIEADGYLAVQLVNTAVPKATGKAVTINNLWLFEFAHGRFVSGQLYADTAAARVPAA
jgi:ketosteroid isomerase-like protein